MLKPVPILAALALLAPIAYAEETPAYTVTVAPDAASYSSLQVVLGEATVTVTVVDAAGAPVADAPIVVRIIRQPWVSNAARELPLEGTTGEDGRFTFVVPVTAAAPTTYTVTAAYSPDGQYVGVGSLPVTPA